MERLWWFFASASLTDVLAIVAAPFVVNFILYLWNQPALFLDLLWRTGMGRERPWRFPSADAAPATLFVIPTLLRKREELDSIIRGASAVLDNGYPGELVLVLSIDDRTGAGLLYDELRRWARERPLPDHQRLYVTGTPHRTGKAVAIDHAVRFAERLVARGDLAMMPPVFLNMDADSALSPGALERLAFRLTTPYRANGKRPVIVAANVGVRQRHYWKGWRHFFTVPGQLVIAVAREYKTSIGLGKFNSRPIPTTGVSGALYATWTEVLQVGPRYAAFFRTLRFRDYVGWWLGRGAPKFSESPVRPVPEAMTGPGDDTWTTWIACCARWTRDGRLTFDFPDTPWEAFKHAVETYLIRPVAYDPLAKVYTASPTKVKGLFKQRVRWNCSRVWIIQRFGRGLFYSWGIGLAVCLDVGITLFAHGIIALGLVLFPFLKPPAHWLVMLVVIGAFALVMRGLSTLLCMLIEGELRREWRLLLALPVSGPYHFAFNILATLHGLAHDLLLFGLNTNFAPEETLRRTQVGRIALAYRFRRAVALACRSLRHGDVPLGWFWLGWDETRWTPNGYDGWTDPKVAGGALRRAPARVATPRQLPVAPAAATARRGRGPGTLATEAAPAAPRR